MWRVEMQAPEFLDVGWVQVPGMFNESGAAYVARLVQEANPFHTVRRYREDENGGHFYPRLSGETEAEFQARQ